MQDELIRIQKQVHKTILFVTHDVEEAIRLADKIAVMRQGKVVQYGTPLHILSSPADAFVADLTGAGDVLRRLSLLEVHTVMSLDRSASFNSRPTIPAHSSLREALGLLLSSTADALSVVDDQGKPLGSLDLGTIRRAVRNA